MSEFDSESAKSQIFDGNMVPLIVIVLFVRALFQNYKKRPLIMGRGSKNVPDEMSVLGKMGL